MPENYYSDAAPAEAPAPAAPEAEPKDKDGSDSQTAVLPMSVLGGKQWKPGDEIMLEIVQMNEDGAVVKYASEKGGEEEPETKMSSMEEGGGDNPGNPMSKMMY